MYLRVRLHSIAKIDLDLIKRQLDEYQFSLHLYIELNKIFTWEDTLTSYDDFLMLHRSLSEVMTPETRQRMHANGRWSYKDLILCELHEFANAWLIGDFSDYYNLSERIHRKFGAYLKKSIEVIPKDVALAPRVIYVWKNNECTNQHFSDLNQRLQANHALKKYIKFGLYLDDLGELLKLANKRTRKRYQFFLRQESKRQKTLTQYLDENHEII